MSLGGGLSANLLTSPPGSVDGSVGVVAIAADGSDHGHDPILAVVLGELSVREGIGEITIELLVNGNESWWRMVHTQ